MPNTFLDSLMKALENETPTDEIMDEAPAAGDPELPSQKDAMNNETGNTGAPGDDKANPQGNEDPDRTPGDLDAQKKANDPSGNPPTPGDPNMSADPATEAAGQLPEQDIDGGNAFKQFDAEVALHKNRNEIPLQQQKDAKDPSGNTGDPADNKQTPVTPSGDTRAQALTQAVKDSYDPSGNTGDPSSVNGTPVSKSGDSSPLGKNEWEKAADDKDGNPDSPGVNGDPAPSLESFIAACQQSMVGDIAGTVRIDPSKSLESYAMELGLQAIASRAMEATLTAAQRRALKDSDFGLPSTRQYPLNDEEHVRSAIYNFHWCAAENQRELAKNILKAMRKFGMKDVEVTEGNPFLKYYPDAIVVPRKKSAKKASA